MLVFPAIVPGYRTGRAQDLLGFADYGFELVFSNERKINERHGGGTAGGPVIGFVGIG